MYLRLSFVAITLIHISSASGCTARGPDDSWRNFEAGSFFTSTSPSMSPDGGWIVFASPRSGHGDIYRIRTNGSDRTQITTSPCFECNPLYCPDGEHIIFAREDSGFRHIWITNVDGTSERQVTSGEASDTPSEVSADGKWLILVRSRSSGWVGLGQSGEIVAIRINDEEADPLQLGYHGSFSPDGGTLLFSPQEDEIWEVDLNTLDRKRIGVGKLARYTHDGERIVYLSAPSESLWRGKWCCMLRDGKHVTKVGTGEYALMTSDGENVVYLSSDYQFTIERARVGDDLTTQVDSPTGYKTWMRPCKSGFVFTVLTEDRVGEICVLFTDEWCVKRVAPIR